MCEMRTTSSGGNSVTVAAGGWKRRMVKGTGETLPPKTGSVMRVCPPMRISRVEWPNQMKRLFAAGARNVAQSGRRLGSGAGG